MTGLQIFIYNLFTFPQVRGRSAGTLFRTYTLRRLPAYKIHTCVFCICRQSSDFFARVLHVSGCLHVQTSLLSSRKPAATLWIFVCASKSIVFLKGRMGLPHVHHVLASLRQICWLLYCPFVLSPQNLATRVTRNMAVYRLSCMSANLGVHKQVSFLPASLRQVCCFQDRDQTSMSPYRKCTAVLRGLRIHGTHRGGSAKLTHTDKLIAFLQVCCGPADLGIQAN